MLVLTTFDKMGDPPCRTSISPEACQASTQTPGVPYTLLIQGRRPPAVLLREHTTYFFLYSNHRLTKAFYGANGIFELLFFLFGQFLCSWIRSPLKKNVPVRSHELLPGSEIVIAFDLVGSKKVLTVILCNWAPGEAGSSSG